jgi:hypothetical protein
MIFQLLAENSAQEGSFYVRNLAGNWFELCVFVGDQATGNNRGILHIPHGFCYVVRCLFKGTSSQIFSGGTPLTIWDCMFPGGMPAANEAFENYANYVAVLIVTVTRTARDCRIPYQVTDGPEEPTLGSGSLGNLVCPVNTVKGHYDEDPASRVSYSSGNNQCVKIHRCIFDGIDSKGENGGAVSFTGTGTSSAEVFDCQFSSCVTSTTETNLCLYLVGDLLFC